MKLALRKAIVTGASEGFGFKVAEQFIKEGASLVVCARNSKKLSEAVTELKSFATSGQKIVFLNADVSKEDDVKKIVEFGLNELGDIDILVNNAGVYGPKGSIDTVEWKEWVSAIEINLFGVVLMTKEIIPYMKRNKYGKIINLSGGGATNPLPNISAYAASKAAVVRITETFAKEFSEFNIDINSVAPGALNTKLLNEVLDAGEEKIGKMFYEKAMKQKESGGTPMQSGADLCVYLASHESDGISGKLISAVWDPWKDLQKYKGKLNETDIYTLRRIIPEDRGEQWGNSI